MVDVRQRRHVMLLTQNEREKEGDLIFRILFVVLRSSRENPGARGGPGLAGDASLVLAPVAAPAPEGLSFENHGGTRQTTT